MHDDVYIRLQDRSLDLIQELLAADGEDLSIDELISIEHFIEDIGGIENAVMAVETLREIERAI